MPETTTTTVPDDEVLGIEILPETGAESDALALLAGVLMLLGVTLVGGSYYKSGESFTS